MGQTLAWGDGHTHSDWSDGLDSLRENARLFALYGEHFHFATDHLQIDVSRQGYRWEMDEWSRRLLRLRPDDVASYEAECVAASSATHLTVAGLELIWANAAEGCFDAWEGSHVLVRERLERLPEPGFFRGRSFRAILRELRVREMAPFLAHIGDRLPWGDLDGTEIAGLELRYDIEERQPPAGRPALRHWDRWLSDGKRLAISSGSDCHQMDLWAAGAMHTVVRVGAPTPEAIRAAVREGRSYLSATWHPDLYQVLGYPGIAPERSGGFTPWWRLLGGAERWFDRAAARPAVERIIAASLRANAGRVTRRCFPTLVFSLEGRGPGDTAEARDGALASIQVKMHVPVRWVRLIGQGEVIWEHEPGDGSTVIVASPRLSLRGRRYVRLEACGSAGPGRDEYLLSNPVYLA